MSSLLFEILIIFLLVLANGVFAMAEISLVSSKRSRLRQMAEDGDAKAASALDLAESPNRFLATVQIGITLMGIVSGAFAGSRIAEKLDDPLLLVAPWLGEWWASKLAFGFVVVCITYLSLVVGELIPKRLGMANAEGYARLLSPMMSRISRLASPVVWFLGASTDGLLKLLGVKISEEVQVSQDEVTALMKEGMRAGTFLPGESIMVENVLDLDTLSARELMTPRSKIIWVQADEPHDIIWHKIVVSGHSAFPVYDKSRDDVMGILTLKAIYANLAAGAPVRVRDLVTPPLVVPSTCPADQLLDRFKTTGRHLALLADEFGHIIGLVTIHDIMEAIVGDFPSQDERMRPKALKRDDGSWLVDAMIDCETFEEAVPMLKLPPEEEREYQTFAGWVVERFGHLPNEGEYFEEQGFRVEVIDRDGHRVDKVLLIPIKPAAVDNPIAA